MDQSYTFYDKQSAEASFAETNFTISPGSVKWSLNLTTANSNDTTTSDATTASQGLTLRYALASLLASVNSSSSGTDEVVIKKNDTPQRGMTTYVVRLGRSGSAVARLEVFDVALIDGLITTINHSLVLTANDSSSTNSSDGGLSFTLELSFPPFNQSLYYDPSIGLGVLLGGSTKSDGSGGGSDNTALIVATAVAIPVAIVAVVAVIIGAIFIAWKKRERRSALNLDHVLADHDSQL